MACCNNIRVTVIARDQTAVNATPVMHINYTQKITNETCICNVHYTLL